MTEMDKLTTPELFKMAVAGTYCKYIKCQDCANLYNTDGCIMDVICLHPEIKEFIERMLHLMDTCHNANIDITENDLMELIDCGSNE